MKSRRISLWLLLAFICLFSKEGEAESESTEGLESSDHNDYQEEGDGLAPHVSGGRGLDTRSEAESEKVEVMRSDESQEDADRKTPHTQREPVDSREEANGEMKGEVGSSGQSGAQDGGDGRVNPEIKALDSRGEAESEMNEAVESGGLNESKRDLRMVERPVEEVKGETNEVVGNNDLRNNHWEADGWVPHIPRERGTGLRGEAENGTNEEALGNDSQWHSDLRMPHTPRGHMDSRGYANDEMDAGIGSSGTGGSQGGGDGWVPHVPGGRTLDSLGEAESERNEGREKAGRMIPHIPEGPLDSRREAKDETDVGTGSSGPNGIREKDNRWMLHTPGGGPLDSRCPCLTPDVCPRAFGRSPADMLLLGHLPICQDESKIRCCGASMSVITRLVVVENSENRPDEQEDLITKITSPKENVNDNSNDTEDAKSSEAKIGSGLSDNNSKRREQNDEDIVINFGAAHSQNPNITDLGGISGNYTAIEIKREEKHKGEGQIITSSELKESENDASEDILAKLNSGEISEMEREEYFKPDMLMLIDSMSLMQKSEQGNLMIVTPMPLTTKKKYQQQIENKARSNNMMGGDMESASYINLKDVMHVTHKPEKDVMIVTPQPITPPTEQNEESSNLERIDINTEVVTTESIPFENSILSDDEKIKSENPEIWKNLDFGKIEGLWSQPSKIIETFEAKDIIENHMRDSNSYFKDGITKTTSSKEALIDHKEKLEQVNPSTELQRNVNKEFEIQRIVRESQILKKDPKRTFNPRGFVSPKWSPMHIHRKQPATLNFDNSTESSLLSPMNDNKTNMSENNQDLIEQSESTTPRPNSKAEVNPVVGAQNLKTGPTLPIASGSIRQITRLPSFPKPPIVQINPMMVGNRHDFVQKIESTTTPNSRAEVKINPVVPPQNFRSGPLMPIRTGNIGHITRPPVVQINPMMVGNRHNFIQKIESTTTPNSRAEVKINPVVPPQNFRSGPLMPIRTGNIGHITRTPVVQINPMMVGNHHDFVQKIESTTTPNSRAEVKINPVVPPQNFRSGPLTPIRTGNIGHLTRSPSFPKPSVAQINPMTVGNHHDFIQKIEPTTPNSKAEVKINPIVAPQNFRSGPLMPIRTGSIKHITRMSSFPKSPEMQINPIVVQIKPHPSFASTKTLLSNQMVYPIMSQQVSEQKKLVSSSPLDGPKTSLSKPKQAVSTNAMDNNKQAELTFIHHELLSFFSNLKMWEENNSNLPLKNIHTINPVTKHMNTLVINGPSPTTMQFKRQETQEYLKSVIQNDEDFGKRITPTQSFLNKPSRENLLLNNGAGEQKKMFI